METEVVTIQEPVSTKINIEEAPAGAILDHSSIKVDKVNLSTVLDDEITSRDSGNSTIPGEAEVVNGSEGEKGEAMKTVSVEEDNKIVKEKAIETEKDEQGFIFVHEPESLNKNIEEDAKIILSDVTLDKEDDITQKSEEVSVEKAVIEEVQTETKHSQEQVEEICNSSVNGTEEVEHKATVSVEEISRNGENIVNETVPEEETATDDVETTKRVLREVKKEEEEEEEAEMNTEQLIKTVVEEANEETTAHEFQSFKENVKPVEAVKNADDAEQISSEVTVDKEKEEDIVQNTEEVQESVKVIETPTITEEEIESKASLDNEEEIDKISKDTEEHEHVLVRDIPQDETLVTEAETVDTSAVQEAEILKTNDNETEETEMVKTIISSDEVRSCDVQVEDFSEHIEPRSLEIKYESHGREESVEVKNKETAQEEITEEKLHDVASSESVKYQDNEPETSLVANTESKENFEDIPSDIAVNVDKVDGTQIMEEERGLDSNGAEAEQVDQNRADETEEIHVEKMQKLCLESSSEVSEETSKTIDEKIEEKPESKELGEQANEERTLTDLTPLQEESCQPNEQEKETKLEKHEPKNEEVIEVSSALPSKELEGETVVEAENIKENEEEEAADKIQKSVESHSSLPSSLEEEELGAVSEKIGDEKVKEEEPIVHIKSEDDATTSHERQEEFSNAGEETTVVQAEQTRDIEPSLTGKCFGDEQKKEVSRNSENIENDTYASHSAEAVAEEETATNGESVDDDVETTKGVLLEVENKEEEAEIKTDTEPCLAVIEKEETETVKTVVEDANIVTYESESLKGDDHHDENAESVEAIKNSDDAEQISHEVSVDGEMEEDMSQNTEKVQESSRVIETPTIQEEDIESKASVELKEEVDQSSKDTEEHELVLGRDIPQCETLEAEAVEAKEETEPSLDKEDKEEELTETAKTVIFSDEVRSSDIQKEVFVEHTEPCSSEIKDESHGREESVEVKTKETVQEESTEEKPHDVASTDSVKCQENEPETSLVANTEIKDNSEETATNGESSVDYDAETTKRVLLEVEKEDEEEAEMKNNSEPRLDAKEKEETTTHESESLKGDDQLDKNSEPVEAIQNLDDAEKISREVTVDKEKEVDIIQNTEEVQESPRTIETPTIQGEDIESKASLELKEEVDESSKDIEEHELVLGRDIPQCDQTLQAEAVEVKEDTKPILDKEDKEQEVTETAKTIIFSDEVRPSDQVDVQADEFGEHTEPCSLEIKDESHGREESVEEIVQEERTEEKHGNILDVPSIESEKFQDNEPETSLVANTESKENFEETPSDLVLSIDKEELKDEKINVDKVDGTQIMEEQRSLDSSGAEAEQVDQNRADETEEIHVAKLAALSDVESVEEIHELSLESPSEVIEETSKTFEEKIEAKPEEEIVLVQESKELGEQANEEKTLIDLTPLQEEESSKPNEQDKETVLEKHEPTNEEVSYEIFKGDDDNKGENAESVEAIQTSDDAEQIPSEMVGDIEKEEDVTPKAEKVQESPETPRSNIQIKEEVDQSSKDTEEHELVLGRDIPQCDQTLEAEAVSTSTIVQEAAILKTLETNINETEAVHSEIGEAEKIQETKEDTEVKDESQGREETVETKSKEIVQDESSEEKDVNLLDVQSGESEKCQENEPETTLVSKIESPLDLALKDELEDEKPKEDQVDETQTMEVERGIDLNESEVEQVDQNRTDETEETSVEKLVVVEDSGLDETTHNQTLLDVESVEKIQKPSHETPSEISEETSKTVDEKIEDKPKEELALHQEDQEEGSYGVETKEETVSVPEESCLPNEQENETKLQEKNEQTKEEVSNDQQIPSEETSDDVIHVSSALTSEETVVEAEKIEEVDDEEQVAEEIQRSLETVETVEPHSSFQEHATVSEKTDDEKVKDVEPMVDTSEKGLEITETTNLSLPSVDQKEDIKVLDEEIQIPSVSLPLDEQENVCIQQEEFGKLEAPKLEMSKEDKSLEIDESIKEIEATSDQTLPIETSDGDNTLSSELVSEEKDQTQKLVEEIHEEETEEGHKLQAEEILPTEITPRESSDEVFFFMLASKENNQVTLQDDKREDDVTEAKDTQEERSVSVEADEIVGETKPKQPEDDHLETPASPIILEKNDNKTLIAEAKKGDEDINETETAMFLEESKEEKSQEILETNEAKEATSDQTLPIETLQEDQTLSSELVSRVDDQTPRHVEEIHEEETKEEQSLPVETSQEYQTPSSDLASELDDQTPKQVDEEETMEEHKLQVEVDQILPVETSQEDQTPSLVKEILEEETKETHNVEAEDTVPRESFSEAPVSVLASGEEEPVTMQEGNYTGDDTQEEPHVSAEAEEKVVGTKPKEPVAEETEKSDDQIETSTKLTEVEDENTKKTDTEVAELTDYSTVEAEEEDENSSTLPVVEILKGLHQLPLETDRELNDSTSMGENVEPADQEQKKDDDVVESNEKYSASEIIEEVKVQDDISREFEVNVEEELQEETADLSLTELLPVVKILSAEKQEEEDVNDSISEKISLQEEQKEKKEETHESVKEEDEIVENKEEKKSEEEQDEKLWDSSATRDIEEIFSSEVKDDKEVHSVLGSEEEINEVVISEKQVTEPVGVITKARESELESNEEHIETQVILDDTKGNDEVSDDKCLTKDGLVEQIQATSSALVDDQDLSVKKPSGIIQPHQSPNQVEETSLEVNKEEEEDKNEENDNALITDKNVEVKDQSKDSEASVEDKETSEEDKETSEEEQKSNDLKEDIGTNVKLEVHGDEIKDDGHDSVVQLKEETGLIEEKKKVEQVKTELEDAIKHGVSVEEKNKTSEKIECEAAKEINQEESKQTNTVKEEIREEEKETNQECFKKTDDTIDLTQTKTRDIESLSSVSKTHDKPELKDEVPNQKTREIAFEVPKIADESENKKDLFAEELKESEPTEKESARKSLSDLIPNTTKNEDATTEPHIEEKLKTEEEENEDEHNKDDKTSPDSLVMVEAKDTVSIIKTHKKSQGILSGVGSKVKHSISKVKKVLTGKSSSHTTKPSSPK